MGAQKIDPFYLRWLFPEFLPDTEKELSHQGSLGTKYCVKSQ